MDATALLRPHLLDGCVVALGGGGDAVLGPPLVALGAVTASLPATLDEEELTAAVDSRTDALVHDLRPAFAPGAGDALRETLDLAWVTVRAVATAAFLPDARGGRIVLIAPAAADVDPSAVGARAAAENLARTLSIEWARHRVTPVAITPGPATTDAELAALAAFLLSPAGAYYAGCRLALGELPLTA
jgi:NAD(P)-dependent dehydrogenase (short-subunit alcohol dehydrogenase family)